MEQLPVASEREQLATNRGLLKWILFTVLTLGIYALYTIHAIAKDVNVSCGKDGKHTRGLLFYILVGIVTLGIYTIVWNVLLCSRMHERMSRAGETPNVSGLSWFLWSTFGNILFGLGGFIAEYKLLHAVNRVNSLYNEGK